MLDAMHSAYSYLCYWMGVSLWAEREKDELYLVKSSTYLSSTSSYPMLNILIYESFSSQELNNNIINLYCKKSPQNLVSL